MLHRTFRTVSLIINQQMHCIKFHVKTLKIAPIYLDPKIILTELPEDDLRIYFKCFNVKFYIVHLLVNN